MAKEIQAISVEARGAAVVFEAGADETEVTPGRVAIEGGGDEFAAVIIGGKDEVLACGGRPPLVRRGVMLKEFADGGALPTAARFGTGRLLADQQRIVLLDVLGDRCSGPGEIKTAAELVGDKRVVKRLGDHQNFLEELFDRLGPELFVITAGGFGPEGATLSEPSGAQPIQLRPAELESFAGGGAIHLAAVEQS